MVKNLNDVLAKTFFIGLFWILDFMSDCDGHNKNHMPLPDSHELWKKFHLLCCKILWLLQALLGYFHFMGKDSFFNIWAWFGMELTISGPITPSWSNFCSNVMFFSLNLFNKILVSASCWCFHYLDVNAAT